MEHKRSPAESKALFIHGLMSQREQPAIDEIEQKIAAMLCMEHKENVSKCIDLTSEHCSVEDAQTKYNDWVHCCSHIADLTSLRDKIRSKLFDEIQEIPEDLPLCKTLKDDYIALVANVK